MKLFCWLCLIFIYSNQEPNEDESNQMGSLPTEPELFQTMDDIASLGLDAVVPGNLFGLDQFGDLGSTDLLT